MSRARRKLLTIAIPATMTRLVNIVATRPEKSATPAPGARPRGLLPPVSDPPTGSATTAGVSGSAPAASGRGGPRLLRSAPSGRRRRGRQPGSRRCLGPLRVIAPARGSARQQLRAASCHEAEHEREEQPQLLLVDHVE